MRTVLRDRQQAVETLLEIKRGESTENENAKPPSPIKGPAPALKRYRTNSAGWPGFVNTLEHRRFAEFCDACRRYRYIGLCYGPSGVGKTLSAKRYSRWDEFRQADRWRDDSSECPALDTVFYTPSVVNSPGRIETDVSRSRAKLKDLARRPLRLEAAARLASIRQRDKQHTERALRTCDWFAGPIPKLQPTYGQLAKEYGEQ